MHSWQAYSLVFLFRMKRLLFDKPGELNVEKDRRELELLEKYFKPMAPITCTPVTTNGVPAEWIIPQGLTTRRVILYIHGGSFNSGSIISHRPLAANIAIACQARVLIIDYRLAPEFPYPAALEDSWSAYDWLLANGIPANQIAVMGDSAGGTLTLSLLNQLRMQGKPLPALAVCLSPGTDYSMWGESWKFNKRKDFMLDQRNIQKSIEVYLRDADRHSPLVSPVFGELQGLPPILIQVGSDEVLLSDASRFVEKAKAAGVPATLEVWEGMQHVWQYTASFLPEARRAIHNIGEFSEKFWSV
jgi:epsilon-lactone hydrolase